MFFLVSSILWADYTGQGVDQLQKVIDTIKTNPEDRRIIMCAWNPKGEANGDLLLKVTSGEELYKR